MPTIQKRKQIAATTTEANILSGDIYEFMPYAASLNVGLVVEAVGVYVTILLNDKILCQDLQPAVGAAATTMPVAPDNYPVTDEVVMPGDRLTIRVYNSTGGALYTNYALNLTPLE